VRQARKVLCFGWRRRPWWEWVGESRRVRACLRACGKGVNVGGELAWRG
jgi:hypothetical protein